MFSDGRSVAEQPDLTPDVLVIGSGAVGLTLGLELARRGVRTCVVEAGTEAPSDASQAYFRAASMSARPLEGLHIGRFRAFGGTTNFWGGQLLRFEPEVFKAREAAGGARWPIGRTELDPWYDRADAMLRPGVVALADEQVWESAHADAPPMTRTVVPFLAHWCPEPNLARLLAPEIAKTSGLRVLLDAPVVALVGMDGQVQGVQLASGTVLNAPKVVLANGTIEISRLLQLPYANGAAPPWHGCSWLGRGFMDHLDCYAGRVEPIDRRRFHDAFDNLYVGGAKYSPRLRLAPDAQESRKVLGIGAHFVFNSSVAEDLGNLKILIKGLARGRMPTSPKALISAVGSLRFAWPMALRYLRHRRMYNPADRGISLRLTSEQRPLFESRVSLRSDRDDLGMPQVNVHWQADQATLETMAVFGGDVADYLAAGGFARVELDARLVDRSSSFLEAADDANHHMGTARMSDGPADGVVDRNLRVHGTRNLYVAGAAVYPTTGFANPTFTAIALGLRLAEHIARG